MLRGMMILVLLCTITVQCWSQDEAPLTEPTNRAVPTKIETANVFCFCQHDQSVAYVPAQNHSLVHQFVPSRDSSPQPLEFPGKVQLLSCSPNGKTLAALVDSKIHFASRASQQSKHVAVPLSPELESPSEFKWSADSNVLFAVRSDSPASVTRIVLDQSEPFQDIPIGNRIKTCFPNSTGDLFVAFNANGAEIWRKGELENKMVKGRAEVAASSPDGRFVAFNADDKIQIWTLAPLGKGAAIAAYGAEFVRFSDDGKQLVISEVDDKIKCYSVSDDGQLSLKQEYESSSRGGWLSGGGTFGACFSHSDTSRLMRVFRCDTTSETEISIVTKSAGIGGYDPDIFPEQFMLSQDGRRGLVEWPAGRIELFDIRSRLSDWGCRVPNLAHVWLVANGEKLLTIDKSGSLQVHDTTNGRVNRHEVKVVPQPQAQQRLRDTSFRFQMLPDGKHCVAWCGSTLREFVVVELATQKIVGRVKDTQNSGGDVRAWQPSDDGSVICVVKEEVELLRTGFQSKELKSAENSGRFHRAVKAFRAKEPTHGIYDTKSGQMLRTIKWDYVENDAFRNWAHISRDGELCALVASRSDGEGNGVEVRSTKTGEQRYAISLGDTSFTRVDFTNDQTGMWVVTREALMRLDFNDQTLTPFLTDSETRAEPIEYDPKRPTPLPDSKWQTTQFESFAESDTGWIATGHRRGFVNIWSVKDRKRYGFLRCGTERVKALAFSSDGNYLMSWCADRNQLQVTNVSSILSATPPEPIDKRELDLDF